MGAVHGLLFSFVSQPVYLVTERAEDRSITLHYANEVNAIRFLYLTGMIIGALILINMCCLLGTAWAILRRSLRNRRLVSNQGQAVAVQELKLAAFAMLLSGSMLFFASHIFLVNATKTSTFAQYFRKLIVHLSTDSVAVINPFGLIALSDLVRKEIAKFLLPKKLLENEKLLQRLANSLLILPVTFVIYLIFCILSLYLIQASCGPHDFGYSMFENDVTFLNNTYTHLEACQIAMKCDNTRTSTS